MNRRKLSLWLLGFCLAFLAGPAPPALAFRGHAPAGDIPASEKSGGTPQPAPAAVPATRGSGSGTATTRYLILVPDLDGFYYAPWAVDFYWGWPFAYTATPYGTWYAPPSPYLADEGYLEVESAGTETALDLHVRPRNARVVLDGKALGPAKDYDRWSDRVELSPGAHVVEMEAPGHRTLRVDLDAGKGRFYSLHYRLKRGQGVDPRSPRDPAEADWEKPGPPDPSESPARDTALTPSPAQVSRSGRQLRATGRPAGCPAGLLILPTAPPSPPDRREPER